MPGKKKVSAQTSPPAWIRPQLALLVKEAPSGPSWLHEIKYDGYRLHARIDGADVRLLTRSGLDWTHKYPMTAGALAGLGRARPPPWHCLSRRRALRAARRRHDELLGDAGSIR